MVANNPQSVDRAYKFMYKVLGIRFHRYFYGEGEIIEFIETEISGTGQRKDAVARIDRKKIQITEFMSKPLDEEKLKVLCDYHISNRYDPQYGDHSVRTSLISTTNPNQGINEGEIDDNLSFHVDTIFTKDRDGRKVLSTLVYKTIMQEELSDDEAIDLLILPDMDIEMPIKALMSMICFLIGHANIPDNNFRADVLRCEVKILSRFFQDEELTEMIEMLRLESESPEIQRVIKKYGQGFESIYFDGKSDGIAEGIAEGRFDGITAVARNLLVEGFDEEVISRSTGLTIDQIRDLKRKL